jgi:hypothetical protein
MSLTPPPSQWAPPPGQYWRPEPGPSVGWAAALWSVAALSLVGALLCGAFSGYGFWTSHHMATEGVTTTAIVSEVDSDGDITLVYTTDTGEAVTAEYVWMSFDVPAVDDELEITYDPDDPSYVVPEGSDEDRVMAIIFAAIAGVGLLISVGTTIGAILIHRARSRNYKAAWRGAY